MKTAKAIEEKKAIGTYIDQSLRFAPAERPESAFSRRILERVEILFPVKSDEPLFDSLVGQFRRRFDPHRIRAPNKIEKINFLQKCWKEKENKRRTSNKIIGTSLSVVAIKGKVAKGTDFII